MTIRRKKTTEKRVADAVGEIIRTFRMHVSSSLDGLPVVTAPRRRERDPDATRQRREDLELSSSLASIPFDE